MSTAIAIPQAQLDSIAENCVKSNLFGIKTREQALTLMALCQAEGLHPATAMRDYHLIQNRPAMKADAMLARFQKAGGVVEWQDYTDAKVSAHFSHPQSSPKPVLVEWTFEQAKRIGLTGKDNWRNYPRAMLRARVISEGVRTIYPGVCVGTFTVEEVQDMAASVPATSQEYTFVDPPTPQATPQDTPQAAEQETAQAAPPKPADWDELALKNRAKEIVNEKAILEITQKRLWKDSGHDWAKFIELLEQEPDPIF